ncbi:MAG: tRNA lysidine(34) synthetase TilS [Alphaproteobacteria bacterium]|uniref:tRNA(Ile)-lysidine synthase n=1 Tax=Candidatus Nitrobium versatile TaxID=2884831 RepID=A0A953J7J3_9BACT|nr:tRNA lysidine(34) synthetase TilS [Candidatus Nitrobium versatile]
MEKVEETIRKYGMFSSGDHVLVALSGGPDSVCLLSVFHRIQGEFSLHINAAYIDHGLRPHEVPGEIRFCEELCTSLEIPFSTKQVDVAAHSREKGINRQEAARELRYRALNEIAASVGAGRIALGHTADDQAETLLMRLFRGAGPAGLSGIPPVRQNIVRPLIETERNEIEDFLAEAGRGFIIDSSNLKDKYTRNRIRHFVLPAARAINADVVRTLARTAEIFREEERYFNVQVTKALMKLVCRKTDTAIELFLSPMEMMDTVLLRRVVRRAIDVTEGLRGIGFFHIEEITGLIKKGKAGDRLYLPRSLRVIKGYSTLLLTVDTPERLGEYILNGPGEVVLPEASLVLRCSVSSSIEPREGAFGDGRRSAAFDAEKACFPLQVRSRRPGDLFYPLGFGRRKKLQDFFVDEKVPRDQRDAVPLLVQDEKIVWVVGYRPDERYRVDKETKRVLQCEIKQQKC